MTRKQVPLPKWHKRRSLTTHGHILVPEIGDERAGQVGCHRLAVADLRGQLTASLNELASLKVDMAARAEKDLVRLALAIAHKVVQREVRVDHEIALTLTRVALARVHSRAGAVVRLHPDDYTYVSAHRAKLNSEAAIEIVEDRNVGPGGCIVQSEMGEIDARIEQQFAEIEQDFLGA